MDDLDRSLKVADEIYVPDLWAEVEARAARPERHAERGERAVAVAIAAVVVILAGLLLVRAFGGERRRAVTPLGVQPNGPIAVLVPGPSSLPGVDNTDIALIDPAGGSMFVVSAGPERQQMVTWSPDGSRVAYIRTTSEAQGDHVSLVAQIVVAGADGSGVHPILTCASASDCGIEEMAWSPDDRYLAWVSVRDIDPSPDANRPRSTVEVVDAESGVSTAICDERTCGQAPADLAWSADGSRFAFSNACYGCRGLFGPSPSSIWVARADGSDLTRLTTGGQCDAKDAETEPCWYDTQPAWAPEGEALVFVRTPAYGQKGPTQIVVSDGSRFDSYLLTEACGGAESCIASQPSWAPNGSSVMFSLSRDGTTELERFSPSTGTIEPFPAEFGGSCSGPWSAAWSPDATSIAFVGGEGRSMNLCVVSAVGDTATVLVSGLPDEETWRAKPFVWLPASTALPTEGSAPESSTQIELGPIPMGTVVFSSAAGSVDEDMGEELYAYPAGASEPRRLTTNDAFDGYVTVSPEGSRIAFARSSTPNTEIWTMNADGSDERQLTDFRWGAVAPAWSPDGERIAFSSGGDRDVPAGLYVMDADGSGQRLVVEGNIFTPTWTADGSAITFALNTPDGDLHLRTAELATGQVSSLIELPGSQDHPDWSPDGGTLLFSWWSDTAGTGIYAVDADGTNLRRVVGAPFSDGGLSWSPDGQWLVFSGVEPATGPQLYVVRRDGSDLLRVTDMATFVGDSTIYSQTSYPSWGP